MSTLFPTRKIEKLMTSIPETVTTPQKKLPQLLYHTDNDSSPSHTKLIKCSECNIFRTKNYFTKETNNFEDISEIKLCNNCFDFKKYLNSKKIMPPDIQNKVFEQWGYSYGNLLALL